MRALLFGELPHEIAVHPSWHAVLGHCPAFARRNSTTYRQSAMFRELTEVSAHLPDCFEVYIDFVPTLAQILDGELVRRMRISPRQGLECAVLDVWPVDP